MKPASITIKSNRIYFLDNLRSFIIFLVVMFHAGVVYESTGVGAYFWMVDDPATNDLVGLVNLLLDIFLMPALFFISGYFTPASMGNRDGREFLVAKFKRLMLPWLIAVLTLMPVYKIIFLISRNMPQQEWTSYIYFSNGIFSQSWLWFLPVLFLFNCLYLLLARLQWLPARLPLKLAVTAAFSIAVVSTLGMDILQVRGWTKTALINYQNERLLIYFMAFLVGVLCFHQRVFAMRPGSKKWYIVINVITWIPFTSYLFFLLYPYFKPGGFVISPVADRLVLWLSFYLSMLCFLYLCLETFWRYFNKPGKMWNELNANSYYVYIIHVIVMGGIAMLLLDSTMASMLKYFILTLSTYISCNILISAWRAIYGVGVKCRSKRMHRLAIT